MPTATPIDPLADDLARTQRALERAMKMLDEMKAERDEARARLGVTDCAECDGEGGFGRDTDFGGEHDIVTMKCLRCGGTGSELEALRAALARVTVDLDATLARAEKAEARSDALAKRMEALEEHIKNTLEWSFAGHIGRAREDAECSDECSSECLTAGPRDFVDIDKHRPDIHDDRCDMAEECLRCIALDLLASTPAVNPPAPETVEMAADNTKENQ